MIDRPEDRLDASRAPNALGQDVPGQDVPGQDAPGQDAPGQDAPGQDARSRDIDGHDIRDGELVSAGPRAADASLCFIGRIGTPWSCRADCPRRGDAEAGPVCSLHVDERWAPACDGLVPGAELQILYWMHQARRDLVRLSPGHGDRRGPFALRAPTRPNPIASSRVCLVACDGGVLHVRGLDCIDGTPLLDIKPWRAT